MAEVFAIDQAIDYIINENLIDVKIVTDSRSALMTFESLTDNRAIIYEIKEKIKRNHLGIKLLWVRAHQGVEGNERADTLAKNASERDNIDAEYAESTEQIRNIQKERIIKES
ncbi:hypothetical protein AVEN_110958-1 [Araneus ventricosus]|uniref:ribonuclease H n=1 Tax=Araneus ventricosus TaxID=182803 RepID=A0A4Y2HDC2_ARAVE|nr:hypothetical protein AVEN_110958-1 [Araneus ventricosus]